MQHYTPAALGSSCRSLHRHPRTGAVHSSGFGAEFNDPAGRCEILGMPCKGGGDRAVADEAEVVLRAAITGVPHLAMPVQLCREEADFLGCLRMRCHEQLELPYFRTTFVSELGEMRGALHGARSWESLGCPMKISVLTNGFLPEEDAAYEAYRQMILKAAESENSKEACELIARALFAFQDPDVSDDRGETATWKVCRKGDVGQLRLLLLGDADVTKADACPFRSGCVARRVGNKQG